MHRRAVSIFFLINGFVYANWAARIPALQESLALDNKQIGFILLAHAFGAFIAMPVTGFLIGRFSSKWVSIFSGLVFPFFLVIIPWMDSFSTVLIPFFLMGIAAGVMDVAMNAQAVEVEKLHAKPIMTRFHALFSIGMVFGGIMGGWAISYDVSLQNHFLMFFAVAVVTLSFASRGLYPDEREESDDVAWIILPKGAIVGLGVIAFCCMMGEGAISDWSTMYMKQIVESEEFLYAYGLTSFAALMTVGRLLGDKGRQRFGDRRMLIGGSILALLGMGFVLSLLGPYLVILGFGLVGLGVANIVPIVYSLAGSMPGMKPGVGIAMSTTIGYSGFMIGPPLIGFLADVSSLYWALFLVAGLFLFMSILIQSMKT